MLPTTTTTAAPTLPSEGLNAYLDSASKMEDRVKQLKEAVTYETSMLDTLSRFGLEEVTGPSAVRIEYRP
ncbi:hypothetical protein GNI_074590 [Gregarina niphandrodes]|uniref:Uncharacterized protein n=1 Tax=Gregarina niphandrodes TaxID=110365 RepID=A0A023B6W3_GRENI|nr:hypothetical protein GNI_074590 [Gregarina niphandrodes]EZG66870.1 hypothetical protein GNI_074590 [Gregarina niphandrodes]|eukprot:XP_011130448.1 hypothetical protein GNI_074590 [Gregarina niphandrodes]